MVGIAANIKAALGSPCRIVGVRSEEWSHRSASWTTVTVFRYLTINSHDKDKILDMLDQLTTKSNCSDIRTFSANRLFSLRKLNPSAILMKAPHPKRILIVEDNKIDLRLLGIF